MKNDQQNAAANGSSMATMQNPTPKLETRTGDGPSRRHDETTLLPPVDVAEDAEGITLYADLPGVAKDKLDVRVESRTLSIEGELGFAMPQQMAALHAEVQVTRYRRTFTLSEELDGNAVDAEFNQGVLRLRIPKVAGARPRRIEIQVH
jgi:HSP20 family molecular chaperone IbpA